MAPSTWCPAGTGGAKELGGGAGGGRTFPNCGSKYELTVLSRCTSFIRTRRRRSW